MPNLRSTLTLAAAVALTAMVSGAAVAAAAVPQTTPTAKQTRKAGAGRGAQRGGATGNPVATALRAAGLTADQKAKVKDLTKKRADDLKAIADRTTPEGRAQMKTVNDKYEADVRALLTPDQAAKFDTALLWAGPLGRPLAKLKLTDDEKTKVEPILKDEDKAWDEAASLKGKERKAKNDAIVADFKGKIRPLLTTEQQVQLDTLSFAPTRRTTTADRGAKPAAPGAAVKPGL